MGTQTNIHKAIKINGRGKESKEKEPHREGLFNVNIRSFSEFFILFCFSTIRLGDGFQAITYTRMYKHTHTHAYKHKANLTDGDGIIKVDGKTKIEADVKNLRFQKMSECLYGIALNTNRSVAPPVYCAFTWIVGFLLYLGAYSWRLRALFTIQMKNIKSKGSRQKKKKKKEYVKQQQHLEAA